MSRETDLRSELKQLIDERHRLFDALKKKQEEQLALSHFGGSLDTIDQETAQILTRAKVMDERMQEIRKELADLKD
jgi:hypothetical protein